jgi:hypothetical protein
VDKRDLGIVFTHDGPLPHPKEKGPRGYNRDAIEELQPKRRDVRF